MTSLTAVQTKGVKRSLADAETAAKLPDSLGGDGKLTGMAGGKRRQKWKEESDEDEEEEDTKNTDGNVIGLEVNEESSSSDEAEDEEEALAEEKEKTSTEKASTDETKPVEPPPPVKTQDAPAPVKKESKPAVFVPVHRSAEVQAARMQLPILAEEQAIVEAIHDHPVVILAGETGSGKTTQVTESDEPFIFHHANPHLIQQVPQFLFEAGYATNGRMIGVTEPRRVAATSMANRVAEEMNLHDGQVGYQIRFEGNIKENTRIKFMTDGVLLKVPIKRLNSFKQGII